MLFNSHIFVLLFLPVCVFGHFILNHFKRQTLAQVFLLGMSLWFYGYFNINYLPLILLSIVANYGFYYLFRYIEETQHRKVILISGLTVNLGLLFYFKYYDFFIENINAIFGTSFVLKELVLPLAISFFTFQQISFIVDTYRGQVLKCDLLRYASFVTFFPQLIAGPIVTYDELIPQFSDQDKKRFHWDNFAQGLYLFAFGLAKKVLIADTFGNAANWGFANIGSLDSTNALLAMLSYTIQIYFDFSGYCDMAIGIGKMFNIDLPLNFNSPYKSLTITEFWTRWHMTLTRFLTKYVYIPLGGNRKGTRRTYINVMIVFLLSGLWHGANYTFILWGALHGLFCVITRHAKNFFDKLHPVLNWAITFVFINVTWVFFRADSMKDALRLLHRIAKLDFGAVNANITSSFQLVEFSTLLYNLIPPLLDTYPRFLVLSFFVFAFFSILGAKNAYERAQNFKPTRMRFAETAILLIWCVFSFAGMSTFLYFNF